MIGVSGLEAAVEASKNIFAQLQSGHPGMKAFLVLAHHGRQTELTSDPIRILEDCEPMIASDDIKREALRLLSEKGRLEATGASEKAIQPVIKALAARRRELRVLPEVQVEIRFHVLKYALVWALQKNPMIDRELTPQTKASIRIVLGTIGTLSIHADMGGDIDCCSPPRPCAVGGQVGSPATRGGGACPSQNLNSLHSP